MNGDYVLRKAELTDVEFLLELRMETMDEHLKKADIILTINDHKERVLHNFEFAKIILYQNEKIGLLKLLKTKTNYEIEQFQIKKNYQGKGIGSQIIKGVIRKIEAEKTNLKLSVLKRNKAQLLYKRLGFEIIDENKESYFMIKKGVPT